MPKQAIATTDFKNLAFSSEFDYEHVAFKNHVTFTLGSNSTYNYTLVTIPHKLGYIPFFRVFVKLPGGTKIIYKSTGPATYGLVSDYQIDDLYADATNLYVGIEKNSTGGAQGTIYYRIYAERQS